MKPVPGSASERPARPRIPRGVFARLKRSAEPTNAGVPSDPLLEFAVERGENRDAAATPLPRGRHKKAWIVAAGTAVVGALAVFALFPLLALAKRSPAPDFGKLSVDSRPAGALVTVDGVERGVTPLTMPVAQGAHSLVLRHAAEQKTVQLTVTAGEQHSQYFEFVPPAVTTMAVGQLSVATGRPGIRVLVDGRPSGTSPLVLSGLAAGEHVVAIATDAGPLEQRVTIEPGATTSVVISVPTTPAVVAGWVAVSAPFEVQLYQDQDLLGSSAASKIMMVAGRYDIRLSNATLGFEETRRIEVAAGKTQAIRVVAPTAQVNINARPWADVSVDGRVLGQTPMANVSLAIGTHEVTFRHPQFGERRQTLVVTVAGPNRVNADLTKR